MPHDRREELLMKGGLDPKKDLINLSLKYNVCSLPSLVMPVQSKGSVISVK